MQNKIFVDVETSGSCPISNGVISSCWILTDEKTNIIDKKVFYSKPVNFSEYTWSFEAEKYHGISSKDVKNFPEQNIFCYDVLIWLKEYENLFPLDFVCHASKSGKYSLNEITKKPTGGFDIIPWFDFGFIEEAFRGSFFSDGSSMLKEFYKILRFERLEINLEGQEKTYMYNKRFPLVSTVEMGRKAGFRKNNLKVWAERIGFELNHHDAESDTLCCLEVYRYLEEISEQKNSLFN